MSCPPAGRDGSAGADPSLFFGGGLGIQPQHAGAIGDPPGGKNALCAVIGGTGGCTLTLAGHTGNREDPVVPSVVQPGDPPNGSTLMCLLPLTGPSGFVCDGP